MGHLFSTAGIQTKERFDYWNDVVFQRYAPCLGKIANQTIFNASTSVNEFGSTEISDVVSDAIYYDRRKCDLNLIERDDIFISVMTEGSAHFEQHDRRVTQQVGDVLIYDSGRPYAFRYPTAYKATLIRVPRPLLTTKIPNMDQLGANILTAGTVYNRLVRSLVEETHLIATSAELIDEPHFVTPSLEMLTTAISRSVSGNEPCHPTSNQLATVKNYIRQHLNDEDLSLETIAKAQCMSVRTLSRLFAEIGETPRQWLQNQRLAGAYQALSLGKVRNVTEAAFQFGFKDLSHFSRRFKDQYGMAPKSLLE